MVNSHYVPQFILRGFADNERIQYCDIKKQTVETRNVRTSFSEKGYYPDQIENDLCYKAESQFARLLKEKILNEKYKISLSRDDIFILKKYLIISIARFNCTDIWELDENTPDAYVQSYSKHFYENLNKILSCEKIEDMMEYLNFNPFEYLDENFRKEKMGEIKLLVDIKNILHSYLVFVKTNRCGEKFIISDIGYGNQATHLSTFSGNKFDKCMYTLQYAQKTGNPYVFHISQMMSPYDYFICPVSDNMAIMSFSIFYKLFNKKSDIFGLIPVDGLSVKGLLGFGSSDIVEAPGVVAKHSKTVGYNYEIKQLASDDVYYLNSALINQAFNYIGYRDLSKVSSSIDYYIKLPESYRKYDLSFITGNNESSIKKKSDRLVVNINDAVMRKIIELTINTEKSTEFNNILYHSLRVETIIVDRHNNTFLLDNVLKRLKESGKSMDNLNEEVLYEIINGIVSRKSSGMYPDLVDFMMPDIRLMAKIFNPHEFDKNPYLKTIKLPELEGDIQFSYETCEPFELFLYSAPAWNELRGIEVPKIGCFPEGYKHPVMRRQSTSELIRSVSPNETESLRIPLKNANGNVLILGCGMGYFAYMVSEKENVKSVTIIESDPDIYNIFKQYLLPQFKNKDKVRIINQNELDYLSRINDGKYNYCFSDICLSIDDIGKYFKAKETGRNFKKTTFDYWIETSFASRLAGCVFPEIVSAVNNHDESLFDESMLPEYDMKNIRYIRKLLSGVTISTPYEIDYYMNPKNIIKLIENIDIKYDEV